jgi:hypothetical protein
LLTGHPGGDRTLLEYETLLTHELVAMCREVFDPTGKIELRGNHSDPPGFHLAVGTRKCVSLKFPFALFILH